MQEEKVSPSQVEDIDREGIPAHLEAQEPQHDGIQHHPNRANDEGKKTHDLDLDEAYLSISVVASIQCYDVNIQS